MRHHRHWLVGALLLAAGCATAPADTGAPAPGPTDAPEAGADRPAEAEQETEEPAPAAARQSPDQYPPAIRAGARVADIRVRPRPIELTAGDTLDLSEVEITPVDSAGEPVEGARLMGHLRSRTAALLEGRLIGLSPGRAELTLAVMAPPEQGEGGPRPKIFPAPVVVNEAPVARVEILEPEHTVYTGTAVPLEVRAITVRDEERRSVQVDWRSRNPDVARVTDAGYVRGVAPGNVTVVALAEGVEGTIRLRVRENPVREVRLTPGSATVRTGTVLRLEARALDASGREVPDIAVTYSVAGSRTRSPLGASTYEDGAFVASRPGTYRVVAAAGNLSAEAVVTAEPRDVKRDVSRVGQGLVSHHPSSDLWVFEGRDGRDYAYVGTHAGGQKMFAWDVTDPAAPALTDSIVVDARVVNDVKVNDDAGLAVITREGASDRQNGIVLLDITEPAHPTVLSEFTETLSGGVHNTFIVDSLVYAIHDGTLDVHIIDISEPEAPREVGRWGIDRPGKYLHDIWVVDGLAYVSYWDDGVWILDVGDGRWGGTPTDPAVVSSYSYTDLPGEWGNTHVALPYTNSEGNTYLFVGDEVFGCEECVSRSGPHLDGPRGYIHVLDLSDPENLEQVARYEVPEAGVHNLWAEDDKLYAAYYEGGLRVVDVSGELRGDLYEQGREIAWFPTGTPDGHTPNQPMAWGPQPYEGRVFVSDLNSGLWIVQLEPEEEEAVLP